MSSFEQELRTAKARQRRIYAMLLAGLLASGLLLASVVVFTRGMAIRVLPADASQIASIKVTEGFAYAIGEAIYALSEDITVEVSAPGYRTEKVLVPPEAKGKSLDVLLSELPGRLLVTTAPQNKETRWYINGKPASISASLEAPLDAGKYVLRVDNPFYLSQQRDVQVDRASDTSLSLQLSPVQGQLVINSIPPGADVRIDGKPAGKTPLQLPRTGGQYDLALSHPDYADVLETLRITNTDSVISRTYRLERKPAILTFSVSPAGGVLLVNGKQIAPSDRVTVSAKTRNRISYRKPGYLPATRQLTLAPNETKRVSIALRADVGAVTIRSRPEASVIVDGKPQGKTPITLKLTAIPHEILLKKEGYRTVKKRVTPTSKQPIVINARLISQTAARLAEAPRSYKNSLGVELKLFEPTGFVMGAPRSQKGQRANEFVRQIKLTRPFYVGRHEITNGQYASFNKKNAAPRDPKKPATSIKWIEAALYCNWLSAKEGLAPFYVIKNGRLVGSFNKANGYRLVTEAEWEWLARKANRSKQTVFPWGDKTVVPPMAGNIADETAKGLARFYVPNYTDGHAEVAPVGSFKAEKSGLFDLTGNVSEWVHNYYSLMPPEPGKIEIDPLGPNYGEGHVIKGSNWRSGTRTELRAAYRDGLFQGRDDVGFRIARYL